LLAQDIIEIDSEDYGDRLKIGFIWQGDLSFNPLIVNYDYDIEFNSLVFGNGIFALQSNGSAKNYLAMNTRLIEPYLLRIKLKPDVTFHNGNLLTARDVKLTYDLYRKFSLKSRSLFNARLINSVEDYGLDVVRIKFETPITDFNNTLGILPILPSSVSLILQKNDAISQLPYLNPIGLGNFQFSEYDQNQNIKLDSYLDHTFGRSILAGVEFLFYKSQDKLLDAFLREEIDLIEIYDKSEIQKIIQFSKEIIQIENGTRKLYYINLNNRTFPFNTFSIRRAFNHAIDKDQIINNLFRQNGNAFINNHHSTYLNNSNLFSPFEYKPLDALKILNNIGYQKNAQGKLVKNNTELQFDLYITKGSLYEESIARIIAINLGEIGISVTPISIQPDELNEKIKNGQYQAALRKYNYNPDDKINTLRNFYYTQLNNFEGKQNFKNLSFDLLLDFLNNTIQKNEIEEFPEKFNKLIRRHSPCVFLFLKDSEIYAIDSRFENTYTKTINKNGKIVNQFKPKNEWFVKENNHKY
jgi:ABC-type transport system substrate-binding protein